MITRNIPSKDLQRWTGPYLGNYYGVIWKTFNIDLDKSEGKIIPSRRFERIEDTISDFTGDGAYTTFLRCNADCTDRYWALRNNGGLCKTDSASPENSCLPSDSWDTDALDSTPITPRDMAVIENDSRSDSGKNKLFVTTDSGDIAVLNDSGDNKWTGSWWITKQAQTALTQNVLNRPIDYFPFVRIGVVGSGNFIHTITRTTDTQNHGVTAKRLVLPNYLNIRHIFHTNNREWILTDHKYGGIAQVAEWDGSSTTYNNIYDAHAVSALSGVDYYGSPIILNSNGQFLEFDGVRMVPMVRNGQKIALPLDNGVSLASGTDTSMTVAVAPRGMSVGEDRLIYINLKQGNTASERYSAGVWCLDPLIGRLYNKYSIGRYGDSVDYGHQEIATPGALYWINSNISERNLLAGGTINTTGTAGEQTGIWLLENTTSTTLSKGYIITQFIQAEEVQEMWDSLWLRFKKFATTGSQFIGKAKGTNSLQLANKKPLQATITWTSTTTFTLTLASADDSLSVGDEVEILNGVNSGLLAHITEISGAHGALQTITIDETATTGSSTSKARFERWKKLGIINNNTKYVAPLNIGITSSFLQLKIEIRGTFSEMELSSLILNSNINSKSKK
jgi:hypothetical protein